MRLSNILNIDVRYVGKNTNFMLLVMCVGRNKFSKSSAKQKEEKMQDILKFRMFNKIFRKFTYYSSPRLQFCSFNSFGNGLFFPLDESVKNNTLFEGGYDKLQFCTGRKDVYGKLIFSGDIVKEYNSYRYVMTKTVDLLEDAMFGFNLNSEFDYEIIGNTYEPRSYWKKPNANLQL